MFAYLSDHCELTSTALGSSIASTLLLSQNTDAGLFSRITMTSMTSAWYHRLTNHVDVVLICLLIFEVLLMRYFLILPIDLTKWIDRGVLIGSAVSKRKRREAKGSTEEVKSFHRIVDSALTVIQRLDEDQCFMRTLCELERHQCSGNKMPQQLLTVFSGLKGLWEAKLSHDKGLFMSHKNETLAAKRDNEIMEWIELVRPLDPFQKAILAGSKAQPSGHNESLSNATLSLSHCEITFTKCATPPAEIFDKLGSSYFQALNEIYE